MATGLLQRVEVSGFRLLRRAPATQQKCRKIQAPRGLREIGPGRTADVNFLLVFIGESSPPMQKPTMKRAAWLRGVEGGGAKRALGRPTETLEQMF